MLNDPRNIGIGPAGRAFMGALLRLGDALETPPHRDSGSDPKGEAGTAECEAPQSGARDSAGIAPPGPTS